MVKRAHIFLEDSNFDAANNYAEKILDNDPENAEAYLIKTLAGLKIKKKEDLVEQDKLLSEDGNFLKALSFAKDQFKAGLELIQKENGDYIKAATNESIYNQAKKLSENKDSIASLEKAIEKFR